jgi:hypothetical protein
VTKRSSIYRSIQLLVLVSWALGCGGPYETKKNLQAVYDPQTGRLRQLLHDSNKNGKTDSISYMDGTKLLRIEIDQDEDGKAERWEYYGSDQKLEKVGLSRANDGLVDQWAYRGSDGTLAKMETSTSRDGKVQRTEIYQKGVLVAVEEDADDNGAVDKWETYSGGTLTSVAFDTRGTGHPTRRLLYASDGSVRIEESTPTHSAKRP